MGCAQGRGRRWRQLRALLLVAATAAGASCASERGAPAQEPLASDDPGVSHVHGLGVNPADGEIFAATHYGLFALPDKGTAQRVAGRYQDTMAFTVVGPDAFLGSGHPDLEDKHLHREGKPPHLGLVSSDDAGETWDPVSLLGEADFHALTSVQGRIYAYDSTGDQLLVSDDRGRTWDRRIGGIGIVGLAASPSEADVVLAVTPAGIESSSDGGRTFTPVSGAPKAVLISWSKDAIWSVDAQGVVWRSPDIEAAWIEQGRLPGEPEAFTVAGDLLLAAVADSDGRTSIYSSADSGRSWKLRYRDRPS